MQMEEVQKSRNEKQTEKDFEGVEGAADGKKLSRRRTKTGCLTCRKRRIKCGEEHPICANCIKSKRDCEGYKQPVIFKHPNGEYQHLDTIKDFNPPYVSSQSASYLSHPAVSSGSTSFAYNLGRAQQVTQYDTQRWAHSQQTQLGSFEPNYDLGEVRWAASVPGQAQSHTAGHYEWQQSITPYAVMTTTPHPAGARQYPEGYYWQGPDNLSRSSDDQINSLSSQPSAFLELHSGPADLQQSSIDGREEKLPITKGSINVKIETDSSNDDERKYSQWGFIQTPSFNTIISTVPGKSPPRVTPPLPPEDDEEDPWDVEFDFADADSVPLSQAQHDLSSMLGKFANTNERQLRTFNTFLDGPSILTTYRPSISASPLNDEKVARIFCHFVTVTGPCLSIFERQATPSPMTFSNSPIPAPQKALWMYTMPSIALYNPALLHAMLALSALHISKLQETSEDPAIKHYTYAVRRIGKLLGLPRRRHETATLAANLLVGFYEVMSSDHSRWNIHLAGARVLVMEFDFATMTRTIRAMRQRARQNVAGRPAMSYEEWLHVVGIPESLLDDKDWEIDESLVSNLTGYRVEYDRHYQSGFAPVEQLPEFSFKEIDDYKTKCDLYWWYCKQDVFQSMVSGDPLLMPYRHWIYCPPRGQFGKSDAAYATMDHLVLIMARLADFGGKDRVRKVKMVKAQGGQWKPPPHFFGHNKPPPEVSRQSSMSFHGSNPSRNGSMSNLSTASQHKNVSPVGAIPSPSAGPGFYGMMPMPKEQVPMHSAFYTMNANIYDHAFHDPTTDEESVDSRSSQPLEDDTTTALIEHSEIVKAFDLFFQSLGEGYQPLPADSCPPISTPFGPALQYRNYPIACVWAFYYVGRILIHRLHPHMPPAAMIAAGVTAHLTTEYAQQVGRICAGLYYPQQYSLQTGNLNPSLGAALMESTFCLLFAAVQFHDASQRGWTISKLRDIAHKTGWQTAAAIAAACEVSWEKMGEAGKGPPYKPTMDRNNMDLRVRRKNKIVDGTTKEEQDDKDAGSGLPRYDRNAIHTNQSTRVHWALGLLSVEKDIEKLNLDKG